MFEGLCPVSDVEGVGNSLDLSLCVLASPLVMLVVTSPFPDVTVDCEVVFTDSDCEFVEPQAFSHSRKREASVALECETEMSVEGPPVKLVPESVWRRRIAKHDVRSITGIFEKQSAAAKERFYNKRPLGLVHQWMHLRSTTWRWTTRFVDPEFDAVLEADYSHSRGSGTERP